MSKSLKAIQGKNVDPLNNLDNNLLLISFDGEYNIISSNASFQKLTQLSSDELDAKNFKIDFCKNMPDYTIDEIFYLLDRQKSWQGNFLLPIQSKKVEWFNTTIFPIKDDKGKFIGFTFLATLSQPQQDLISIHGTAESWMYAIFNDPEQANVLIGLSGEVIDFNMKASKLFKWYSSKVLDANHLIVDYFNSQFSKTFQALYDKAKVGQRQKFIRRFKNASSYNKILAFDLRPVISRKSEIMGVIMVISDISADIALEKRIRLSEKKLDEIAFINAHELRAPLASILGLVHLLDFEHASESSKIILTHLKNASNDLENVIHKVSENTYLEDHN